MLALITPPLVTIATNWKFIALMAGSGVITGWAAAARADYQAFKGWHAWHQFAVYDWRIAGFRWFHGAVVGLVSGVGTALGALGLSTFGN